MAVRLALLGHQLPVDDRVRVAPAFEARAADGRVDSVGGGLLVVEVADRAPLAVRVAVARLPLWPASAASKSARLTEPGFSSMRRASSSSAMRGTWAISAVVVAGISILKTSGCESLEVKLVVSPPRTQSGLREG